MIKTSCVLDPRRLITVSLCYQSLSIEGLAVKSIKIVVFNFTHWNGVIQKCCMVCHVNVHVCTVCNIICTPLLFWNNLNTSSTARGGGGSFKKRKTIGEIGCCESRMSKQKHWPTDYLANWLIDWLTNWLTEKLPKWQLTSWLTDWLTN